MIFVLKRQTFISCVPPGKSFCWFLFVFPPSLLFLLIFLSATYLIHSRVHNTSVDLCSFAHLVLAPSYQPSYKKIKKKKKKIQHTGCIYSHCTAKRMNIRTLCTYQRLSSAPSSGCQLSQIWIKPQTTHRKSFVEEMDWV